MPSGDLLAELAPAGEGSAEGVVMQSRRPALPGGGKL